jgi:hypothetical protein
MLLLLHIIAALSGLVVSTYSLIAPSTNKIRLAGGLVILTFISGTVVVLQRHSNLMSACVSGIVYIGFTSCSLYLAARRLSSI